MMGGERAVSWVISVTAGLGLLGLGVFLASVGLDKADKWSSAIGVFATLIGVGLSAYGVVLARRGTRRGADGRIEPAGRDTDRQVRQQVRAGRDAYVAGRDQHFGSGGPERRS